MKPTREQLRDLLRTVESTAPEELDCNDLLARVAVLLETLERGEKPPPELEALGRHLAVCPQCKDEFDALLRVYDVELK